MEDRTGISTVYIRYIRPHLQDPEKSGAMTPKDVVLGIWHGAVGQAAHARLRAGGPA